MFSDWRRDLVGIDGDNCIIKTVQYREKQKEASYTVQIPMEVEVGGEVRTEMRVEERTRVITVQVPYVSVESIALDFATFSSVAGRKVEDSVAFKKHLSIPRPAIIKFDDRPLDPFY